MKQPKPEPVKYPELLSEIESGVLKIPDFQRDVVWDISQTLALLDSIAKKFPIGTFIFWETDEILKHHRNIGNLKLKDVPQGRLVKYIIDGQQRITSLYACLKKAEINGKKYAVYCDLDASGNATLFYCENPYPLDPYRYVNIADVLGDTPHLVYDKLSTERKKRFNEIRDAFRYYDFSTVKISECDIDVACEIFERINTMGTELDVFDIVVAKTWSEDFDLRGKYDEFVKDLESVGYEGIGSSAILQAVSCITKKACHRRDILSIKRDEMKKRWDDSIKAIRLAIDYLRDNVRVLVWRLLPYPSVIAPIAYFYHTNNFKKPTMTQSEQLKKFFWRCCLSQRYSSGAETNIRNDIQEIDKLLAGKKTSFDFPLILDLYTLIECDLSLGNAYCKTILCYLASQSPRNFENNGLVNLENNNLARANSKHYHHFFPKSYLRNQKKIVDRIDSVMNICFITADSNLRISNKKPLDYLNEIEKTNPNLKNTLKTHLIFDYNTFGITADDYDAFLKSRANVVLNNLNKLIERNNKTK